MGSNAGSFRFEAQSQGSEAGLYACLSLLKAYGNFNNKPNGADTAHSLYTLHTICRHLTC